MSFKVGDRVKHRNGIEAEVTDVSGTKVWVLDHEEEVWWDREETFVPVSDDVFPQENDLDISSFEQSVRYHTNKIADLLIAKNKAYGDSALNPVRIFSKSDRMEQLYIRLDDKLSRVQKGHEYPGDDTLQDIIGYCTLILIARESN